MQKIQRVSSYLVRILNVLIIALPLFVAVLWLFIDTDMIKAPLLTGCLVKAVQTPEGVVNLGTLSWTLLSKILGFTAHIIGCFALFLSFFPLRSIFKNYQKGEIFSTAIAKFYRSLGLLFFLDAVLHSISESVMVLAVTLLNPPGHRYLTFGIDTPAFEQIFCGVLVLVMSWVMLEASKLHDEHTLVV